MPDLFVLVIVMQRMMQKKTIVDSEINVLIPLRLFRIVFKVCQ